MSLSLTFPPRPALCRLTLRTVMPCRRRVEVTTDSPPARISPFTSLPDLSLPSHEKLYSLMSLRTAAAAVAICLPLQEALFVRDRLDLFERGNALLDLEQSRFAQVANPFLLCLPRDVQRIAVGHDDLVHLFRNRHYLINPDASLVAGALACVAADSSVKRPAAVEILFREARAYERFLRNIGWPLAFLA